VGKEYGWRYRRKGYVVGAAKGDPAKFWSPEEYVRLMNVSHEQGVELAQRARLIAAAKDGEAGAQQALVGRLRCRIYTQDEIEAEERRRNCLVTGKARSGKRVASDPDAMRHALCAVRERSEP